MIGLVALVTDVGWMYYQKCRLQTAVNAGWKAGYDYLTNFVLTPQDLEREKANINRMALQVMRLNGYTREQIPDGKQVVTSYAPFTVRDTQTEGLFFARVLNFNSFKVTAQRSTLAGEGGIVPLAIPHGVVKDLSNGRHSYQSFESLGQDGFLADREYILKLGQGGGNIDKALEKVEDPNYVIQYGKNTNHLGALDPDNVVAGGANDYRDRLMYGFNGSLTLDDRLLAQNGNISGPTEQGIEYRLNNPATAARRVIVPIVDIPPEALAKDPNLKTIYQLPQKDKPNGLYTIEEFPFESSMRIVGFAEFELLPKDRYTRVTTAANPLVPGDEGSLGGDKGDDQVRGTFIRYLIKPGETVAQ